MEIFVSLNPGEAVVNRYGRCIHTIMAACIILYAYILFYFCRILHTIMMIYSSFDSRQQRVRRPSHPSFDDRHTHRSTTVVRAADGRRTITFTSIIIHHYIKTKILVHRKGNTSIPYCKPDGKVA